MITCTKTFKNYPFAHRQHNHTGHCALIHGHNWSFTFEFEADELDANGFVIDFGGLAFIKDELNRLFDHTLVINADDPMRAMLEEMLLGPPGNRLLEPLARIIVVPNGGAEGLCAYIMGVFGPLVVSRTHGRVSIHRITVHEDDRNCATLTVP